MLKDKKLTYLFSLIGVVVLAAFGYLGYKYYISTVPNAQKVATDEAPVSTPKVPVKPTPTPKPIVLKPDDGTKGTYIVSQPNGSSPLIKQVVFDPLNVKKGEKLLITVTLDSASSADSMTGTFESDNTKLNLVFQKMPNSEKPDVWTVSFDLTDSVVWKYVLTVTAKGGGKSSTIVVAPKS